MAEYLELVEGSFTQEHEQKAQEWPYVAYSIEEDQVMYSVIISKEDSKYKLTQFKKADVPVYNPDLVDLGLPSGLKWASYNVGASNIEEQGMYFQWGDVEGVKLTHSNLTFSEVKELMKSALSVDLEDVTQEEFDAVLEENGILQYDMNAFVEMISGAPVYMISGKIFDWNHYFDTDDGGSTFKTYYHEEGGKTKLDYTNDIAYQSSNGSLRMPTLSEIEELITNTTRTYLDTAGNEFMEDELANNPMTSSTFYGVRLTSQNGNSIFIPNTHGSLMNGKMFNSNFGWGAQIWAADLGSSVQNHNGGFLSIYMNGNIEYSDYHSNTSAISTRYRYGAIPVRGVQS